jgi:DNA-binding transcriptional LysR family regulator
MQLGKSLLQRSQKRVSLTEAGEAYYGYARQILALQAEAEESLSAREASSQGWIRCSVPESLMMDFLPQVMADFGRQHPQISIDVHVSDEVLDPLKEKLDFAIRGAFPQSSELIGVPLWAYRRCLYASPEYLRQRGEPATPEALTEHDLLMHTAPRILKDWHFRSDNTQFRFKVQPRYRFSSGVALYHAVINGLGICRLGDWVAEPAVKAGRLTRVCPEYRITSSTGHDPQIHVVYANSQLPHRVRLFLKAIRDAAQQRFT